MSLTNQAAIATAGINSVGTTTGDALTYPADQISALVTIE